MTPLDEKEEYIQNLAEAIDTCICDFKPKPRLNDAVVALLTIVVTKMRHHHRGDSDIEAMLLPIDELIRDLVITIVQRTARENN